MTSTMINMNANDNQVIKEMKSTIQYQQSVIKKREMLVKAINHNVKHLQDLHHNQKAELNKIKFENKTLVEHYKQMVDEKGQLQEEMGKMKNSEKELG